MLTAKESKDCSTHTNFGHEEKVGMEDLSKLTGFPTDFIKKELVISKDELSIEELRKLALSLLDSTFDDLKKEA